VSGKFGENGASMERFDELMARWVLDDPAPEAVPDVAAEALVNGCEMAEVAVLAGMRRPSRAEVEDELMALLRRLRVARPTRSAAIKTVVDACARRMVEGDVSPSAGAHRIWLWANECYDDADVFKQLAIFVGLASEWDDDEDHRSAYETDMLEEARALLDAGGLRIG
jgi:hypothetical protein